MQNNWKLLLEKYTKITQLKKKCLATKFPIMRDNTLAYISYLIKQYNVKKVLEIGSGWGFSANYLWINNPEITIDSLEKKYENYLIAQQYKLSSNINFLNISIFDFILRDKYNLIIIDGPKKNQEKIFNYVKDYLLDNGIIFIDNLFLKKYYNIKLNKKKLKILKSLESFREFLLSLNDWDISILEIDDGIAICKRKEKNEISSKL